MFRILKIFLLQSDNPLHVIRHWGSIFPTRNHNPDSVSRHDRSNYWRQYRSIALAASTLKNSVFWINNYFRFYVKTLRGGGFAHSVHTFPEIIYHEYPKYSCDYINISNILKRNFSFHFYSHYNMHLKYEYFLIKKKKRK